MPDDPFELAWLANLADEAKKSPEGRCYGCGLLGKTLYYASGLLSEVRFYEREWGTLQSDNFPGSDDKKDLLVPSLGCRAGHNLGEEMFSLTNPDLSTEPPTPPRFDNADKAHCFVIQRDRSCEDWEEYQRGLTPLWHLEHQRMKQIAEMQLSHAEKLAELGLQSQQALKDVADATAKATADLLEIQTVQAQMQKDSNQETERFNSLIRNLTIFGIVLAFITLFGSVLFPNGIAGISSLGPRDQHPSGVYLVTPTATRTPLPTITPLLPQATPSPRS